MALSRPTIVLFDMDGTVVRHLHPWFLHMLERADDISHRGARLISKIFRRQIDAPPLVAFHHGKRKKLLVRRAMHKLLNVPVDQIVEPCPGIYDILDLLAEHKIPMGLISNGLGKGYGHDVLKKFDLEKYFEVTIFREDITRPKPYPDPILQALAAMKQPPQKSDNIWFIGDRHKDIRAAMAAEIHLPCDIQPIAYTLNAAIAVLEHNLGPDHIFMAWPDMLAKLRKILADG